MNRPSNGNDAPRRECVDPDCDHGSSLRATYGHDLRSVVVNLCHVYECRRCGKQWNPNGYSFARREACHGRR